MWDSAIGIVGVGAAMVTGAVFSQISDILAGLENVGAVGVLGITMVYLITQVYTRLDKLNDNISELKELIKDHKKDE